MRSALGTVICAIFEAGLQRPIDRQLRIFGCFDGFVASAGKPLFEGFGLGRWDGRDQAQKLCRVGHVGKAQFSVSHCDLQPVTICHGFISLSFEALL